MSFLTWTISCSVYTIIPPIFDHILIIFYQKNHFQNHGFVADTERFYTQVQEIILARYNKTFDWSLKAKMMGKKAIESARIFVEETGISDSLSAEQFLVEREDMLEKLFPTSEPMPGM